MRLAALLGILALPGVSQTQAPSKAAPPTAMVVRQAGTEVRAGPSSQFYVTNRLGAGTRVEVVQERPDGWVQIRPPEGSFSWINTRFLDHVASAHPNYVVVAPEGDEVRVYIGSEVRNSPPTVVGAKLQKGSQVVCVGRTVTDNKNGVPGSWMPIDPPARETRYVRAEALERLPAGAVRTSATLPASQAPGVTSTFVPDARGRSPEGGTQTRPVSKAPVASLLSADTLWERAVDADRKGQLSEAIRYYALLVAATQANHPNIAAQALQRAQYLQTRHGQYGSGPGRGPTQARYPDGPTPVAGNQTQLLPVNAPVPRVRLGAPEDTETPKAQPATPKAQQGQPAKTEAPTYRGRLRRSGRFRDGKGYFLEMKGYTVTHIYVLPGPGVDLERLIGSTVQVSGPTRYQGEIPAFVMTAQSVRPLP